MSWKPQFTIATFLLVTLVVAVLCAELQNGPAFKFAVTLIVIQVIAFGFIIEVLSRQLPKAIGQAQKKNCVRHDGTWSKNREAIETKSRTQLKIDLAKAFLLVAVATNMAVWFIHSEVIPIPLAFDAISSFQVDQTAWRSDLSDDENELDRWMTNSGLSTQQSRTHKRMLWNAWPALLAVAAVSYTHLTLPTNREV